MGVFYLTVSPNFLAYQAGATKVKKVLLSAGGAGGKRWSMPELTDLPGLLSQHSYTCACTSKSFCVFAFPFKGFTRTHIHAHAHAHVYTHLLTHSLTRTRIHAKYRCPTDVAHDEYYIQDVEKGARMFKDSLRKGGRVSRLSCERGRLIREGESARARERDSARQRESARARERERERQTLPLLPPSFSLPPGSPSLHALSQSPIHIFTAMVRVCVCLYGLFMFAHNLCTASA
jgi:hypothetical protein